MNSSFTRSIALLSVLILAIGANAAPVRKTLEVGGRERTYLVDLPSGYDAHKAPFPLVLVFHGGELGSAEQAERSHGFRELGEKKNFIAVFPDGLDHHWNDLREGNVADVRNVDDVAFIAALLDRLAADCRIDPKRVYATGISNGGIFSYTLATRLSSRFAAIGPVAGALAAPLASHFALEQPVAVIAFHGTADTFVPYEGGVVRGRVGGHVLSVIDTIALVVKADGCTFGDDRETLPLHKPDDGTVVHRETHAGGRGGALVVLYSIDHGGHTWPGGPVSKFYTAIAGPTTQTIDATALMWDFFAQHPKP